MSAAHLAKVALLRLAQERLEPTPENYARAWAEAGGPPQPARHEHWSRLAGSYAQTVRVALPPDDQRAAALASALSEQAERWRKQGADAAQAHVVEASGGQARALLMQRHHLFAELGKLVRALGDGLTDLAEDQSWAQGQAEALRAKLQGEALSVRSVRSAADMLEQTRRQQQRLRGERDRARAALKALVASLSSELEALGGQTGLNTARALDDMGVRANFKAEHIGAERGAVEKAEDREPCGEALEGHDACDD